MRAAYAIGDAIRAQPRAWAGIVVATVVLYYALLLLSLIVRFGNWPNYVVGYDWPGNVARIFASTPSLSDAFAIAEEEWLLEVGYMNMDFGHGIAEWSLTLVPPKMLVILLLGALLATISVLAARRACRANAAGEAAAVVSASGLGAGLVALTGATMTWVVCCASPSWIVGLAMLGLSVATANWLEPIGPWLTLAGFALLAGTVVSLARSSAAAEAAPAPRKQMPRIAGQVREA